MGLIQKMTDKMRDGLRRFLQLTPAPENVIVIDEGLDFLANCAKNRIWYHGKSRQLSQLYSSLDGVEKTMFWAAPMTRGLEIRKLHTGLAKIVIDMLTAIVSNDFNGMEITAENRCLAAEWEEIAKANEWEDKLETCLADVCTVGDGAFKLSYDRELSDKVIIEWFPAERVQFMRRRGHIRGVKFYTDYYRNGRRFQFVEVYTYGSVSYKLLNDSGGEAPLDALEETAWAKGESLAFDKRVMFAVPVVLGRHPQYRGRGAALLDDKDDAGDALDEVFSQWMDALRAGRTKQMIPDRLVPRDPETGEYISPNPFDNRFIVVGDSMQEGKANGIQTDTPEIPSDSYLAAYITALDIYLQGVISPSTIGIDVKKLDNAEAQREKEKTTLYTRQRLVGLLSKALPKLVAAALNAQAMIVRGEKPIADNLEIKAKFGEYANPSFESQVETVSKARTGGVMSIRTAVDEMYGDSKDEDWKNEEERRIKEENGIAVLPETSALDDVTV